MNLTPKRILCVDDHEDTCQMLEVLLRQAGYDVYATQQPDDALRAAANENFDLFLLDLWMQTSEGTELCRQIRKYNTKTPIIIYSADARNKTQEKLTELNVQAFLVKPKGLDKLLETVEKLTAPQSKTNSKLNWGESNFDF
jgi:DNA-binding response OmpR family regulator